MPDFTLEARPEDDGQSLASLKEPMLPSTAGKHDDQDDNDDSNTCKWIWINFIEPMLFVTLFFGSVLWGLFVIDHLTEPIPTVPLGPNMTPACGCPPLTWDP